MIRDIIKMGHPLLMRPARAVEPQALNTPELKATIDDLIECLHHYKGVGIAANQVGIDKRIVVIGFDSNPRYPNEPAIPITPMINPEITPQSDHTIEGWEGCLSVPGLRGLVPRYQTIHCRYTNIDGSTTELFAENFTARVIQHECDHLDGILFPMRIHDMSQFGFEDSLPAFSNISHT